MPEYNYCKYMEKIISGKEFKNILHGNEYYFITNKNKINNKIQSKKFVRIICSDEIPEYIKSFKIKKRKKYKYIIKINIPDCSTIKISDDKIYSNYVICLENPMNIWKNYLWFYYITDVCPELIHAINTKYIDNKLYINVLSKNGLLLKYIPKNKITKELCDVAFNNDFKAYEFIPDKFKTHDMSFISVRKCGYYLKFVPKMHKTYNLYYVAINNYPEASKFIPKNNKKIFEINL